MPNEDRVRKARKNAQKLLNKGEVEDALVKLDKRDEDFEKAKKNPKQWFKDQGVKLPGDPSVEVTEGSLYIKICWFEDWCIVFDWP